MEKNIKLQSSERNDSCENNVVDVIWNLFWTPLTPPVFNWKRAALLDAVGRRQDSVIPQIARRAHTQHWDHEGCRVALSLGGHGGGREGPWTWRERGKRARRHQVTDARLWAVFWWELQGPAEQRRQNFFSEVPWDISWSLSGKHGG